MKRLSISKIPGIEVHYTQFLTLLVKEMLSSKLHHQICFGLKVFLLKIGVERCRRRCLVANRATLPQKWPPPLPGTWLMRVK